MQRARTIEIDRLMLRRPVAADADQVFERYAGDPDVCEYTVWHSTQCVIPIRGTMRHEY